MQQFQSCELDLRSVVFVTLLQIWFSDSLGEVVKNLYVGCNYCFFTQRHNKKGKFIKIIYIPVHFTIRTWLKYAFHTKVFRRKCFVYN